MKIFTLKGRKGELTPGATPVKHTLTNGAVIDCLLLGEAGRNRKLTIVPTFSSQPFLEASLGTTATGRPRLNAPAGREEGCLVVALLDFGFRGRCWADVQRPDQVIAEGKIADGAAGNMASGLQYLLKLMPGDSVVCRYAGRLYGGPEAHVVRCVGGTVEVLGLDELDLAPDGGWS